jgi:glycosyltransferase involved in cell wall biosynthesis
MRILVEMRPAFDGHAGIPQETRLLFRGLNHLRDAQVEGLIQSSNRVVAKGLPATGSEHWAPDRRFDRLSKLVVSLQPNPAPSRAERRMETVQRAVQPARMLASTLLGNTTPLTRFDASLFRDFVWRSMFAKTLPPQDFDLVTSASYRVARVPWSGLHRIGLATRAFGGPVYPRFDTSDFDVLIAETPFPGRVSGRTRLVVRYHDAIPLTMPHTIHDRSYHRASHYHALRRNLADNAWFACVSDATRRDLVSIFPAAAERALTIPNMVSHHYHAEASPRERVPEIVNVRRSQASTGYGASTGGARPTSLPARPAMVTMPRYLLMVSTIEPRKNHLTLLAAWEQLRSTFDPSLRLVLVGALGWDHAAIESKLRPWVERGQLHLLEDVPAPELRILYRHAAVTVCPSFAEGFDFSGVESMRCGGIVAASNIPVHRDVYEDASEYFNPYSAEDLARTLALLLATDASSRRDQLVEAGARVSAKYMPDRILPLWDRFLRRLAQPAREPRLAGAQA